VELVTIRENISIENGEYSQLQMLM
jgi:hypothetical protein